MEKNPTKDIRNDILGKLNSGEVKMTRRQFFVLKWLTLSLTSLFLIGFAIYIFAYIVFLFVDSGIMYIPLDRFGNLIKFIVEIPWTLVLLGVLSVFLFSITSKTFYRIYKKITNTFKHSNGKII